MRWMCGRTILSCIVVLGLSSPAVAQWSGQITQEDGHTVVLNPETPTEGSVAVELEPLWTIGGYEDDTIFGVISQLVEDAEGNVYLLDSQLSEIQVFSPAGEYLRTIGREGEGPGEFRNASDMYFGPGGHLGILQVFPGKIVQLTPDGEPAGNFPLPEVEGGGFQLVFVARGQPDRIVIAGALSGQGTQNVYLRALDPQGERIVQYHEEDQPMQFGGMKFEEETNRNFVRRWALADDGRIAAALDFEDYEIHLWNPDGSVDRVLRREGYEPVERTDDERDQIQKLFSGFTRWNPGSTYEEAPVHMTVQQVAFRPDGTLWVLPADGAWRTGDGVFASYDVYDREGRYLQRVDLLGDHDPVEDGVFFTQDRIYVVTDLLSALQANTGGGDEDDVDYDAEPMSVVAYRLDWQGAGR